MIENVKLTGKYKLRKGWKVRLLADDVECFDSKLIVGLIKDPGTNCESPMLWSPDRRAVDYDTSFDLIEAVPWDDLEVGDPCLAHNLDGGFLAPRDIRRCR